MSGISKGALGALALVCLFAISGCPAKKEPPKLVRDDNPPVFGQNGMTDVGTFLQGKWCRDMSVDAEAAKQLGLKANKDVDSDYYWEFNKDGTVIYTHNGSPDKVHGKWFTSGKGVQIKYDTFNDTPLNKHMDELHAAAGSGRQSAIVEEQAFEQTMQVLENLYYLELSSDMKSIEFKQPGETDTLGGLTFGMYKLARMKG